MLRLNVDKRCSDLTPWVVRILPSEQHRSIPELECFNMEARQQVSLRSSQAIDPVGSAKGEERSRAERCWGHVDMRGVESSAFFFFGSFLCQQKSSSQYVEPACCCNYTNQVALCKGVPKALHSRIAP